MSVERALEEVVRNADRHGAGMAALTAQHAAGQFTVQVSNMVGVRSGGTGGWGWNNSVRDVLRSIGGSSTLRLHDGRGVAELSWPHSATDLAHAGPTRDAAATYRATVDALGVDMREVLSLVWWVLAGHTVLAVMYSPHDRWIVLQALVAVVIWLVSISVFTTLTRGAPSLGRVVAWHAVLLVAVALSLWQAGPESLRGLESWAIGMASVPMALAALFATVRRALLALPLAALVASLAVTTPTVGAAGSMGAIWVSVIIPGAGLLLGILIRRAGRRTASADANSRFRARQAYARWAASRTYGVVLTSTRDLVLPFLTDLDLGRIEADSPQVRSTARRLAHRARDELNAPGLLDTALRDRIELARERGVIVTLEAPVAVDREQTSVVLRLLDRLLDGVGLGDRVIVQVGARGHAARLVVISPHSGELTAGLTALTGSLGAEYLRDEYGTTITIPSASTPATPVEELSSAGA